MLTTVLLLSSLLTAMPMPEVGVAPPEAVPFEIVSSLAIGKAAVEWPGARLGTVLPYLDESGRTVAWFFQFRTDGRAFPGYDVVADDIRAEREALGPNADLTQWRSRYAFVLVSARYDRAPILAHGRGVSEYYAVGRQARERARAILGVGAELSRLYFDWPRVNLEFRAGGRDMILSAQFERIWRSRADYVDELTTGRESGIADLGLSPDLTTETHRRRWDEYISNGFVEQTDVFVPEIHRAPFYDWSYGCTPTSGAMVLGYIDRTRDFGRLVRWNFARMDLVVNGFTWQIPNAQRECAIRMRTDSINTGGTNVSNISGGLRQTILDNGYDCRVVDAYGESRNDWAWSTITSEIDAGNAMIWSALWERHSLTAFGYRLPDKDVYVHNTWWQPAAWWHYSGDDWSHISSPTLSGGSPYKLELTYPIGDTFYNSTGRGDVLQVGNTALVSWDNRSNPGTRVEIDISNDRGRNWSPLATDLPDNGSFTWPIDSSVPASDSVRLRLRQYQGSTLTSADASFGDFILVREPLPPLSLAPPNGRQLFEGGIILVVDTVRADIDSFEFRLMQSTDTILRYKTDQPFCPVPDSLFTFGRSYKWVARGRNSFGWGDWGTPWTFWCRFGAGVAEGEPPAMPMLLQTATIVGRRGEVVFHVSPVSPGARLQIYDALGTRVQQLPVAGRVSWNGRDAAGLSLPAGLYFARLDDADRTATVRFILVE